MKKRIAEKLHIGDKGSTIITVIVAIAFVTILTSVILGSSVVNIRMKAIDRRMKDDFYYAEKFLNDVYTGLGQKAAEVAGTQYEKAFELMGTTEAFKLSEKAEAEFRKTFIAQAATELKLAHVSDTDAHNLMVANMQSFIVPVPGSEISSYTITAGDYRYEKYDGTVVAEADRDSAERIRIMDVVVTTTDDKDFQSAVSTDIVIEAPTLDFLSANIDVTDYSLIANKGLYIEGDAVINGNVYAGIHEDGDDDVDRVASDSAYGAEKVFGGININGKSGGSKVLMNGNYITSKGDINLSGDRPQLTVGNDPSLSDANLPNIYFDTLRTYSGATLYKDRETIILNSNTFALNDLELDADNSFVKVRGNYYGYNDKTLPSPEPGETPDSELESFTFESGHDDADSSAIIINGSHSTLDMSEVRSLVLMGKAYVDFDKGGGGGENKGGTDNVAATAEALALKTNQQLYLIPTDLLDGPNPVSESWLKPEGADPGETWYFDNAFSLIDDPTGDHELIKDWFGYDYVDASAPFKVYKVEVSEGSGEFSYYAYMNFNNKLWVYDPDSTLTLPTDPVPNAFGYRLYTGGGNLGSNGSVSSMEAFFDIVMNDYQRRIEKEKSGGKTEDEAIQIADDFEEALVSPSPFTIFDRIKKSMDYDYFDLQDCVIGSEANEAILYSRNSIVNYHITVDPESSEKSFDIRKLDNNKGMDRYANYPQNLFHRYQWLATRLDSNESITLETDPNKTGGIHSATDVTAVKTEWNGDEKGYYSSNDAPPLDHFVALDKVIGKKIDTTGDVDDADTDGLSRNAYGDCIIWDCNRPDGSIADLVIGSGGDIITAGNTFKGVAIVNGNITVKSGTTVNGLLMATGAIVLEDGVTINYDKGLLQSRIEKEMSLIRESDGNVEVNDADANPYKKYFLITYLTKNRKVTVTVDPDDTSGIPAAQNKKRMYKVTAGSKKREDRIEADYHNFMFFENWQKGL